MLDEKGGIGNKEWSEKLIDNTKCQVIIPACHGLLVGHFGACPLLQPFFHQIQVDERPLLMDPTARKRLKHILTFGSN